MGDENIKPSDWQRRMRRQRKGDINSPWGYSDSAVTTGRWRENVPPDYELGKVAG